MRVVIVGAGEVGQRTAELLIGNGHEVVMIDTDAERIEELSDELDCGFLHGDGSTPQILEEAGPDETDLLLCLTDNDQSNIIGSLLGRAMGYGSVVTRIENPQFESICRELDLERVIVPSRTISRYLFDMASGVDVVELGSLLKYDARLFSFVAGKKECVAVEDLDLPDRTRVIHCYRDEHFVLLEPGDRLEEDDEVILITHADHLEELEKRWRPGSAEDAQSTGEETQG